MVKAKAGDSKSPAKRLREIHCCAVTIVRDPEQVYRFPLWRDLFFFESASDRKTPFKKSPSHLGWLN